MQVQERFQGFIKAKASTLITYKFLLNFVAEIVYFSITIWIQRDCSFKSESEPAKSPIRHFILPLNAKAENIKGSKEIDLSKS